VLMHRHKCEQAYFLHWERVSTAVWILSALFASSVGACCAIQILVSKDGVARCTYASLLWSPSDGIDLQLRPTQSFHLGIMISLRAVTITTLTDEPTIALGIFHKYEFCGIVLVHRGVPGHMELRPRRLRGLSLPTPFVIGCLLAYPGIFLMRGPIRRSIRRRRGECLACAYDLTGNTSGVCPECGKAADNRTKPV